MRISRFLPAPPMVSERAEILKRRVPTDKGVEADKPVWRPIDANFPEEDYERLFAAFDHAGIEQGKDYSRANVNIVCWWPGQAPCPRS